MKLDRLIALLTLSLLAPALVADDKEALLEKGKAKYVLCGACHGLDGKGSPAPGVVMAPAFEGSKIAGNKSAEAMTLAVLKGIKKEDAKYLQIMMPLEAQLSSDEELAALLTYVRNEFAKVDDEVSADDVKAWREKYKDQKEQVTRADLEKMVAGDDADAKKEGGEEKKEEAKKEEKADKKAE